MLLDLFGFLHMSFADILDILLVAVLIFAAIKWVWGSSAMNIFLAIVIIILARTVVDTFNMKLISSILGAFIDLGVLAIVVIFQPEIRHFLMKFGLGSGLRKGRAMFLNKLLGIKEETIDSESVKEITEACRSMSESKTGALIVLPHKSSLQQIIETGDKIDANINRRLIMNLFFKNSPLHDGAMIIAGDRIIAARCTLPITERTDIPASFGMRHKAAIGISEESDADVIVVSEETGRVSFVKGGKVTHVSNINELNLLIGTAFSENAGNRQTEDKE